MIIPNFFKNTYLSGDMLFSIRTSISRIYLNTIEASIGWGSIPLTLPPDIDLMTRNRIIFTKYSSHAMNVVTKKFVSYLHDRYLNLLLPTSNKNGIFTLIFERTTKSDIGCTLIC